MQLLVSFCLVYHIRQHYHTPVVTYTSFSDAYNSSKLTIIIICVRHLACFFRDSDNKTCFLKG